MAVVSLLNQRVFRSRKPVAGMASGQDAQSFLSCKKELLGI